MAGHAAREQRGTGMVRQGDQRIIKDLADVAAHLDDVIVFDRDPSAHQRVSRINVLVEIAAIVSIL